MFLCSVPTASNINVFRMILVAFWVVPKMWWHGKKIKKFKSVPVFCTHPDARIVIYATSFCVNWAFLIA
jgi:hypothetical protein